MERKLFWHALRDEFLAGLGTRACAVRWWVFRGRGTAAPGGAELAPRMVPALPSDYPIYSDSASAGRRIILVTLSLIFRAMHCRIELSKSQASVKNSRLKRRAVATRSRSMNFFPGNLRSTNMASPDYAPHASSNIDRSTRQNPIWIVKNYSRRLMVVHQPSKNAADEAVGRHPAMRLSEAFTAKVQPGAFCCQCQW